MLYEMLIHTCLRVMTNLEQYQDNSADQVSVKLTISVTHQHLQMKWSDDDLHWT